jgi:hypothetical protein
LQFPVLIWYTLIHMLFTKAVRRGLCFISLLIGGAFLLSGCFAPQIEGGEITIKNDIQDRSYNVVQVSHVATARGRKSYRVSLNPGQHVVIPYKHIRSLRFTRRYKDHAKVYEVTCPKGFDRQITMKLIDVHTNRIAGGCKLTRKGKARYGSIKWEK